MLSHIFGCSAARPCSICASVSSHHLCCLQFTIASFLSLVFPSKACLSSLSLNRVFYRTHNQNTAKRATGVISSEPTKALLVRAHPLLLLSTLTSSDELGLANLQRTTSRNDELSTEWCDISVLVFVFRQVKLSKHTLCHVSVFILCAKGEERNCS